MGKSMKVLVVGPYPREEGNRVGGVEVHTSYLTDGLTAYEDLDVHVVTAVSGIDRVTEWRSSTGVKVHQVPLLPRFQFLTDGLVNIPRMRAEIRKISPDIVHVHTTTLYAQAAVEIGYPTLLTVHGIMYGEAALCNGLQQKFQFGYRCRLERGAIKRARHILCLNDYALSAIKPHLNGAETRLIDNGVDDRFFALPDRQEPGRVFFAGMIADRKNVLGLLEAARMLRDSGAQIKLCVAGKPVDPEYYERCLAYVSENHLEECVDFLGNITVDQMLEEMSFATMLVLPAKQETSPMIISEAMAAGKPVVATAAGGIGEVVKDGETGFIVPFDDSQTLADKIGLLLKDDDLRGRLGRQAKDLAVGRFDRKAVIEKTLQYYRDIAAQDGK